MTLKTATFRDAVVGKQACPVMNQFPVPLRVPSRDLAPTVSLKRKMISGSPEEAGL